MVKVKMKNKDGKKRKPNRVRPMSQVQREAVTGKKEAKTKMENDLEKRQAEVRTTNKRELKDGQFEAITGYSPAKIKRLKVYMKRRKQYKRK